MCVRTSSIGDDFHIIVLQEFPLDTLNQCVCLPIYFFLTLSRIVIVTFIQFTWLLFFVSLFTKLWPPLLLLVFFYILKAEMYTKYRDTPCVFCVSEAIHWFSIIYFFLFRPQQKHMYTTHNCHSNNVMRFLIESDWGSISLHAMKKQSIVWIFHRAHFSLVICECVCVTFQVWTFVRLILHVCDWSSHLCRLLCISIVMCLSTLLLMRIQRLCRTFNWRRDDTVKLVL